MRQTFKQTYNEIKAAYAWNTPVIVKEAQKKMYWVGTEYETGIMKVSCNFRDILGKTENPMEVWAYNSEGARLEYNALR